MLPRLFIFFFCSSRQQLLLENETKAKAEAVRVTGDTVPLLIKHLGGGHTMHSTSFILAYTFLSDVEETNVYCITKPFTVPLSSYLPLHLCCFLVFSEPKWPHEQRNHGRSWWMPPLHCLPVSLPFPRSITCKDLVFRAHYFLLSSHTLSKAMVSLARLESWGLSGEQGYSDHLG